MISAYNGFLSKAAAYHIDHCFAWKYLVDVRCSWTVQ
jgi:tRNA nucleotidyltransferase (CCA-adding enzyme)